MGYDVCNEPIEVWAVDSATSTSSVIYVTATRKVEPGEIMIPACVPKQSKVGVKNSVHPHAVEVTSRVLEPTPEAIVVAEDDERKYVRSATFSLHPEFKIPKRQRLAQEAKGDASDDASDDSAVADEWIWGPLGDESMHPFWAVRRMTSEQLMKEIAMVAKGSVKRLPPRFNCELQKHQLSCVTTGVVKDQSVGTTRLHEVPFLVNMVSMEEGEELILELNVKKKETKSIKRTWKTAFKEEEMEQD